jgi:hypothetical protein
MMQNRSGRAIPTLAATLFLSVIAAGSQAQINFYPHASGSLQPAENVLMDTASGFNVFGHTNNTNVGIIFTSNENLISPAQGQARVEAADAVGYKQLCIEIIPGWGFTELELNANVFDKAGNGTIAFDVYVDGVANPFPFASFVNKNGANWFDFEALGTMQMTKVCFNSSVDILDTRQWRIGGVRPLGGDPPPPPNVPEGSSALLLGTGLLPFGAMLLTRRRANKS